MKFFDDCKTCEHYLSRLVEDNCKWILCTAKDLEEMAYDFYLTEKE